MNKIKLGETNIWVSELCFGTLTFSPLQANLSVNESKKLLNYAYDSGVNFLDTAEYYRNYHQIAAFLKEHGREDIIISTKSYSYDKKTAEESLEKALKELGTDYIDIFMLHEQESEHTIRGHYDAIKYFLEMKEKGYIKAIGLSTHYIAGVKGVNKYPELDIVMPIINKKGIGIQDGTKEEMLEAIKCSYQNGKGIYAMKPFGGGHLINDAVDSFNYVRGIKEIHSIAIGMQTKEEIKANVQLFECGNIEPELNKMIKKQERILHISDWCIGCGNCVSHCQHGGVKLVNGKAVAVKENCVFCGYCANHCPEFCIKVI